MSVLIIAGIGVVVVLVSILVLRLHPLLSLLIGSLFLLAATPIHVQLNNQRSQHKLTIRGFASGGLIGLERAVPAGNFHCWNPLDSQNTRTIELQRASAQQLLEAENAGGLLPVNLVWFVPVGDAPAFTKGMALLPKSEFPSMESLRWSGLGGRLADGFTKTFRKLGIPVTMAAIVGICLLESGAAARLVQAIVALFGTRGTAPALTLSGFVLGIPVYFDNVFYLLLPLAKAVGRVRPERFLTAVMAIIVGATMAHSLVPPTPGPLFVAEQMQVSVGLMMLGGLVVGSIAASVGFAYGAICNRWIQLSPDQVAEGEVVAKTNPSLPLWLATLPIAIPICLLGGTEVVEYFASTREPTSPIALLHTWIAPLNDPSLIFIGAAVVALLILRAYAGAQKMGQSVAKGISDAGTIVLLTSAGGAFGSALQQLQIANAIGEQFSSLTTPWGILATAFFLTTIIRAAQGSATVAMLTSSAIIAPVMETVDLPFHPLYVALAIGCGSKPLPWMNDSGFWQVATMTGMTTNQTLKTFTVALTVMGLTGFLVTLLGAWLLPLV